MNTQSRSTLVRIGPDDGATGHNGCTSIALENNNNNNDNNLPSAPLCTHNAYISHILGM